MTPLATQRIAPNYWGLEPHNWVALHLLLGQRICPKQLRCRVSGPGTPEGGTWSYIIVVCAPRGALITGGSKGPQAPLGKAFGLSFYWGLCPQAPFTGGYAPRPPLLGPSRAQGYPLALEGPASSIGPCGPKGYIQVTPEVVAAGVGQG